MKRALRRVMGLMGVGSALVLLLGLFGALHPALVSVSVFRAYAVLGLLVSAATLLLFRRRRFAWGLLALAALGIFGIGPWQGNLPAHTSAPVLLHYQKNVLFNSKDMTAIADDIRASGAMTVSLQEVSSVHLAALDGLRDIYPSQQRCTGGSFGGTVVLSRYRSLGEGACLSGTRAAAMQVIGPEGPLWVMSVHLFWPWPRSQATQVAALLPEVAARKGPKVIGGDFNMVPWAKSVQDIAKESGTEVVGPVRVSFEELSGLLRVPIDHVLVTGGRGQVTRRPRFLSDHYGILARYQLGPE